MSVTIKKNFKIILPSGEEREFEAICKKVIGREGDGSIPGGLNRITSFEDIEISELELDGIKEALIYDLDKNMGESEWED